MADQNLRDFELVVVDNGSRDQTVAEIEKWDRTKINLTHIQHNSENHGFAGGHNEAMTLTIAPYVLMLNQDIILAPDFLAKIVHFLDSQPGVGAVSGKLLRWGFVEEPASGQPLEPLAAFQRLARSVLGATTPDRGSGDQAGAPAHVLGQAAARIPHIKKLNIIDTIGLRIFKSHRVVELGQGEEDRGQYAKAREVFGVSGACPVYRRKALEEVAHPISHKLLAISPKESPKEYFDQDFFSYKEDIDLAYRLQWRGWKAWYCSTAIAWHARSVGGSENLSDLAAIRGRKSKRTMVARWSYRNHLGFLVKNVSRKTFLRYGYAIVGYEVKKLLWLFFAEWRTLPALWQFLRLIPRFVDKRRRIRQNRKVLDTQIWRQMSV